jgi:hypothetical protein
MIRGSCACGTVRFESEVARSMTSCHCVNCRKLTAASVATYVHVEKDKVRWLAGEDNINSYESSPDAFRKFCRTCSSLVPNQAPYLTFISIPAGLFDDDPGVRPRLHVFTSPKAPWHEITDGLPQHPKWVPGFEPK